MVFLYMFYITFKQMSNDKNIGDVCSLSSSSPDKYICYFTAGDQKTHSTSVPSP